MQSRASKAFYRTIVCNSLATDRGVLFSLPSFVFMGPTLNIRFGFALQQEFLKTSEIAATEHRTALPNSPVNCLTQDFNHIDNT